MTGVICVAGGSPTTAPGDTLLYNTTGVTGLGFSGMVPGDGTISSTNRQDVVFANIETLQKVTHTGDSGPGSLRDAILFANLVPGTDTITFDIPGVVPHTITPLLLLPSITDAVVIDGTTEPDYAGTPIVELSGSSAGAGARGLSVLAGPSTIRGLVINRWDDVGIFLGSSDGHSVDGNYIGTNVAGTAALPNGTGLRINRSSNNTIGTGTAGNLISGNTGAGIRIANAASTGNTVGGTAPGAGNQISGNANSDVLITGATATGNFVEGNLIGTDAAGEGNLISGNTLEGVSISNADGNLIHGNTIGTSSAGAAGLANGRDGVRITSSQNAEVGGSGTGEGNVISGNTEFGVRLIANSSSNTVRGNLIGTDPDGLVSLPNKTGVYILGSANTIGGSNPGEGNVISGNTLEGVKISGLSATGNALEGNTIGEDLGGNPIPNRNGVRISTDASDNAIGDGTDAGSNTIADNSQRGVWISAGTGNVVRHNSIHNNGGTALGIDLGGRGVTANDPDDPDAGANNLQNFPRILGLGPQVANLVMVYRVNSLTANSAYPLTAEFFIADASGAEGMVFLGADTYTTANTSRVAFIPKGATVGGDRIVATVTDSAGNTSEFSHPFVVPGPLMAAEGEKDSGAGVASPKLTADALAPIVDAAIERLTGIGFDGNLVSHVDVSIADLHGATLGLASSSSIAIDVDAAGHGWFVDTTPLDDDEFALPGGRSQISAGRIDLLTVVMHELGHEAGLVDLYETDDENDLMYGWLEAGVRKTSLEASLADEAFARF